MKKELLIVLIICLQGLPGFAQQPCNTFDCAYQKAEQILKTSTTKDKYEKVLANLDDAENFAGGDQVKKDKIKVLRERALEAIRGEKERADIQAKVARAEKMRADSTVAAIRRQALTAYANDLAFKSQFALREGKRTEAFQLATFAHRYVEPDNSNVTRALLEALYYNDLPEHFSLPWSSSIQGHTYSITSVAFSPDGKRIATGSSDGTAKIWKLDSGTLTLCLLGHTSSIHSVAFSQNGKLLATGSYDKTAKIWSLDSGKLVINLQGHTKCIRSVAFSPNGKWLATGSEDNSAKIWDIQSGIQALSLRGHLDAVYSVAFSPDGKRLATGSYDKTAKIWDSSLVNKSSISKAILPPLPV